MDTSPAPPALLGRTSEQAALLRLLQPRAGGRVLLVRGEPGVGRSALLAHAGRLGGEAGMCVLSARGVPAETDLPFAALHQLLHPLVERAGRLPHPQRRALLGAFGLSDGSAPSIFRTGLAALELLTDAARHRPVLALADDLQWFDDASRRVLDFVARRLDAGPVVLLGAARDGWPHPFPDTDVPELRLDRLAPADAELLLSLAAPDLPSGARGDVLRWADGNPLALRELPRTAHLVAATDGLSCTPLTERLERALVDRLPELPAATRAVVLAAALHGAGELGEVLAAARAVDPAAGLRALVPALDSGLVALSAGRLVFRHPLVRSAVHQAADPHARISMHRALVDQPSLLPDQRVWHRLEAALGPDPDLAAELQELAETQVRRGALDSAVRALERSAALTSDEATRGDRLVAAASAALRLGRVERVQELLGRTDGMRLRATTARRRRALGWAVHPPSSGDGAAVQALVAEARGSAGDGDRDTALDLLLLAARSEAATGRADASGARTVAALDDLGDRSDDPRCLLVRAFASPLRSGSDVLRAVRSARSQDLDVDGTALVATAAMWVHAPDLAGPFLDRAVDGLRGRGDARRLAQVLVLRAWAGFCLGGWEDAVADAEEGLARSRETEQPAQAAAVDVLQAVLGTLRGGADDVTARMTSAEQVGLRLGSAAVLNAVQLGRALVSMAEGTYDVAFQHLLRTFDPRDPAHHSAHSGAWLTYLAEAAVHAGRLEEARAALTGVRPMVELSDAPQLHLSLQYAKAVLADEVDAEPHYRRALGAELAAWPLDRARLDLAWGGWLRRRRRAAESREPLRRARDGFEAIGALAWAAQARRELRAAGERSGVPGAEQRHSLTAQELQIAWLAAQGLSNREIGQQLYASHRTVASHLYRIFPKLGITSRQQLRTLLVDADGGIPEPR